MKKTLRLVDADYARSKVQNMIIPETTPKELACYNLIDDMLQHMPEVQAVTRDQFHEVAESVVSRFSASEMSRGMDKVVQCVCDILETELFGVQSDV